jgi:hypothetical protein
MNKEKSSATSKIIDTSLQGSSQTQKNGQGNSASVGTQSEASVPLGVVGARRAAGGSSSARGTGGSVVGANRVGGVIGNGGDLDGQNLGYEVS